MRLLTLLSAVLLCLFSVSGLHAQQAPGSSATVTAVPRLVRVAGTFHPANGFAAAPVEIVTLSIYAEETGGAPLWQETQTVAVDADGRYSMLLGSTRTEGLPQDLFASGEARWLGTRFERPGEGEQRRVLLASVPYALRASDADTLGGRPASAYRLVEPELGEGGFWPNAGQTKPQSELVTPFTNSGTPNFIGKFTSTTDLGNSVLFENAGRVGLSVTNPRDFLHVAFNDTSGTLTGNAVQNLSSGVNSYSGTLFYDQNGVLAQFQGFNNATHEYRINNISLGGTINFMTNNGSRFLVANNGDITISGTIRKAGQSFLHSFGTRNLGVGFAALNSVLGGTQNTAVGDGALLDLATGIGNVAVGTSALENNNNNSNTGVGFGALTNASGVGNVAVGALSGGLLTAGDFNMYLGYNVGAAAIESATIRIGDSGNYNRMFMGGVRGVTTSAADAVPVVIDSNGQLGTVNSSRRYKEDIQDMGSASSPLMKLRPVTFRYKQAYQDGRKPIEYGLIAEEVEEVYPDLVAHLAGGEVETVQYHKINAMLLNEVQKQHREIEELKARLAALERSKP